MDKLFTKYKSIRFDNLESLYFKATANYSEAFRIIDDSIQTIIKNKLPLSRDDAIIFVEWKLKVINRKKKLILKRGTFRPSLLKLVESNETSLVESKIKDATKILSETNETLSESQIMNSILSANRKLSELTGIGPATASGTHK